MSWAMNTSLYSRASDRNALNVSHFGSVQRCRGNLVAFGGLLVSEAKHRDQMAEQFFRNKEVLGCILQRMVERFGGEWEDDYSILHKEELSNPTFIVVSPRGVKHKENLLSPLPEWEEEREAPDPGAATDLRFTEESQPLSTMHLIGELVPCN